MAWTLIIAYLAVALVAAAAVLTASERLGDQRRPASHRTSLSLAAGAVWPLVLMGLLELTSVAIYAKANSRRSKRRLSVLA